LSAWVAGFTYLTAGREGLRGFEGWRANKKRLHECEKAKKMLGRQAFPAVEHVV
jgi:hypothetical protein